jgi:hypothetical protein
MEIVYSDHLKLRLKARRVDQSLPREVVRSPKHLFYDTVTRRHVAIGLVKYAGKKRPMAVVYDMIGERIVAITVHPIRPGEIKSRVKKGRWIDEKK